MQLRVEVYGHRITAEFIDGDMDEVVRMIANMAKYENIPVEVETTGIGLPFAQTLEEWGVKVRKVHD